MIVYNLLADTVNFCHFFGFTFVTSFPIIHYIDQYQPYRKRLSNYTYYGLSLISSGVLISYYLFDNLCLASALEHYLNPIKYTSYVVTNGTKFSILLSLICTLGPTFFRERKHKFYFVGTYYSYIFYSIIEIYVFKK